ncbi:snRNA-activating protein complex subunit 4 [Trichogramma pretiosum]|uniref:snRNA-activating protein complex subunit 4 n=1 Tax=Trichogramma pretiosum TaxID=7493 RepID=UPI000C71BD3A|nr:snRNA-activating protein complex subunit 4 [Trichogramma pretiosum]
MIKPEDSQSLLDEIQALEDALVAQGGSSPECNQKTFHQFHKNENENMMDIDSYENESDYMDVDSVEKDNDEYQFDRNCNNLQDLLEMNKVLFESISTARQKMTKMLVDCQNKLHAIEGQIANQQTNVYHNKIICFNAGMPYFKDRNYFHPQRNEDTERKIKNGELRLGKLQRIHKWNPADKSILLQSIKHEVNLKISKKQEMENMNGAITKTSQLPKDVKQAIGSLGNMKFDWLKICNMMPESKHNAEECEVMWNVFLHPDINKQRWTAQEDKNLNRIVDEHENEDWDGIARNLNTGRSGYQCFVRYNTNNWKNLMKGVLWSARDDTILLKLVEKLKMGDYIPWGYIASCMNNWTKQQVYFRWNYSLAPYLKKGRYTAEEDKLLLSAVNKYGKNFTQISALVMPHRTNIQLKEHYLTLIQKGQKKIWTKQEDQQLIELYNKYGTNWAKIKQEFPTASRAQLRLHHLSLQRVKGNLNPKTVEKDTPMPTYIIYNSKTPWLRENTDICMNHMKIDDQLVNYFRKETNSRINEKSNKSEKLNMNVRKFHDVLTKLNVHMQIPEYINEGIELDKEHRSLFLSLQEYLEIKKISISEEVEKLRLKMFGPRKLLLDHERFIPPLPFGHCVSKVKKAKKSNSLDYLNDSNKYQVELPMEIEDDKNISEFLAEDIIQFEKFKNMVTTKTGGFEELKSWSPEQSLPKLAQFKNFETNSETVMKYSWKQHKMVPITECEDPHEVFVTEKEPLKLIRPNRTALQAYQELLVSSENFPTEMSLNHPNHKLTSNGRNALILLKKRYQQLFGIPIGLSRILPPDIIDESAFLPIIEKFKKKNVKKKCSKL